MEHLVVEDMHAVQRVQVLLQQGRSCRVQVHLVQLQDRYSYPEQSLVQGRVLARIKRIEIKKEEVIENNITVFTNYCKQ